MAHEIAKLLLEHSGTVVERKEAIRVAVSMGMSLEEIQEYLDWLDTIRPPKEPSKEPPVAGDDRTFQ